MKNKNNNYYKIIHPILPIKRNGSTIYPIGNREGWYNTLKIENLKIDGGTSLKRYIKVIQLNTTTRLIKIFSSETRLKIQSFTDISSTLLRNPL